MYLGLSIIFWTAFAAIERAFLRKPTR
jgi:polar amino acid transport system permease protein